jgi:hypothetical protein
MNIKRNRGNSRILCFICNKGWTITLDNVYQTDIYITYTYLTDPHFIFQTCAHDPLGTRYPSIDDTYCEN